MGERLPQALCCLTRNVRFEPHPTEKGRGIEDANRQILDCFRGHIPAVIDTHRLNYTGPWRADAVQALERLLAESQSHKSRYLSSVELGQAICQNGHYQDIWTGEDRHLTPIDPPWRRLLRKFYGLIAGQMAS